MQMTQVTPNNVGSFLVSELETLFTENEGVIVADTFQAFHELWNWIVEQIKNAPHFRKDVKTFINLQQQLNVEITKRISALEQKP